MQKKSEILKVLEGNRIIIYGAGYMAKMFYKALSKSGIDRNVEFFVVSSKHKKTKTLYGTEIKTIDEIKIDSNVLICVAVHEMLKDEIQEILKQKRLINYVWISPEICAELFFDVPYKRNVKVSVNKICQENIYSILVRYLAIENYFGKNNYGYEIYTKVQGKLFGEAAAGRRLLSFCKLINDWKSKGCVLDTNILLDKNFEILDGAHRIALARYYQMEEINCDIYDCTLHSSEWREDKLFLKEDTLILFGFTDEEIRIIKDTYTILREVVKQK